MRNPPVKPEGIRCIDWEYYFTDLACYKAEKAEPFQRTRLFSDEELFGELAESGLMHRTANAA